MPKCAASCAAVIGSIEPELFTPSVTRMMMRVRVFEVRRRFTAVAMAWPMAVPSPFSPIWARSRIDCATSRSNVIGTRVAARGGDEREGGEAERADVAPPVAHEQRDARQHDQREREP